MNDWQAWAAVFLFGFATGVYVANIIVMFIHRKGGGR